MPDVKVDSTPEATIANIPEPSKLTEAPQNLLELLTKAHIHDEDMRSKVALAFVKAVSQGRIRQGDDESYSKVMGKMAHDKRIDENRKARLVKRHLGIRQENQEPVNIEDSSDESTNETDLFANPSKLPEEIVIEQQTKEAVRQAIANLPEHQRQAIELRYRKGMRHQEAGEAMGLKETAFKQLIKRALDRMYRNLNVEDLAVE